LTLIALELHEWNGEAHARPLTGLQLNGCGRLCRYLTDGAKDETLEALSRAATQGRGG
jgi:hypothetical protein